MKNRHYFLYKTKRDHIQGFLCCPFYLSRRALYKWIEQQSSMLKGKVMDFGCGAKPYRSLFNECCEYIGVDIETSGHDHSNEVIDVYWDGKTLPFDDAEFDSVFCSEVFEHVDSLEQTLSEINRVMKIGGYMLVTVPFVWNEHEMPYDFKRYTSVGIRSALARCGFEVVWQKKTMTYGEMLYQLKIEYYRRTKLKNTICSRVLFKIHMIWNELLGLIASKTMNKDDSIYGDNIILCLKK